MCHIIIQHLITPSQAMLCNMYLIILFLEYLNEYYGMINGILNKGMCSY